jgi:hypothetical protein
VPLLCGTKVTLFLQTLKQGIKATRTDPVAVPGEFLDHPESEHGTLDGVMKNVEPDKTGVQVAISQRGI